eukprot:CAMPEP_0185041900 /NCGR_PEP_ID=MMETSP1103-20130426/41761_1 /TAXON_ID=36769 /ORGANISM="Paraphysomonas bandaiensis, Strain Caron Lab Isolate" /LENGTH=63 /DNA_ID=CAMNT_0027581833 /DNA_START=102 /DNA_END=293 /DNA_ORIENTATION=+
MTDVLGYNFIDNLYLAVSTLGFYEALNCATGKQQKRAYTVATPSEWGIDRLSNLSLLNRNLYL